MLKKYFLAAAMTFLSFTLVACEWPDQYTGNQAAAETGDTSRPPKNTDFFHRISDSAIQLTKQTVIYDPSYFEIQYPNGDVPTGRGVCSDVIIRAYRKVGIDLQKEVHEDMTAHFSAYPHNWGLKSANANIDHRRVPNLMKFFERRDADLPITNRGVDYQPGELVCWNLGGGLTHIGIVIDKKSDDGQRNLIVHNIGAGQEISDCLFEFKIIGHYRFKM